MYVDNMLNSNNNKIILSSLRKLFVMNSFLSTLYLKNNLNFWFKSNGLFRYSLIPTPNNNKKLIN